MQSLQELADKIEQLHPFDDEDKTEETLALLKSYLTRLIGNDEKIYMAATASQGQRNHNKKVKNKLRHSLRLKSRLE